MSKEMLLTELSAMRKRVEESIQKIASMKEELKTEESFLRQVVTGYNSMRTELFVVELEEKGMTWCTHCTEEVPSKDAELMLFEGAAERSGGYENSCWGCERFSNLHRVCPECREHAQDRHGIRGRTDPSNGIEACFYAFRVESREDGFYARKFGEWVKLKNHTLGSTPPKKLVESLADTLKLPPFIEADLNWGSGVRLVVHEKAKVQV